MEDRQTAQGQGIEQKEYIYIESAIDHYITTYFEGLGIPPQEIDRQKQQRFSACLQSIGSQMFPRGYWDINISQNRGYTITNNKALNIYKLIVLADEYIYISNKYNKMVSIEDYCKLANISKVNIYNYRNIEESLSNNQIEDIISNYINNNGYIDKYDVGILNNLRKYLYKKLSEERQQAYQSKLIDTGQGVPLMYLGNNSPDLLPAASAGQGAGFSLDSVAESLQIAQK